MNSKPQGLKPSFIYGSSGTAEQVAEKLPKYGHSEEAETTKNLQAVDSDEKQVLRFAQDDRVNDFFSNL